MEEQKFVENMTLLQKKHLRRALFGPFFSAFIIVTLFLIWWFLLVFKVIGIEPTLTIKLASSIGTAILLLIMFIFIHRINRLRENKKFVREYLDAMANEIGLPVVDEHSDSSVKNNDLHRYGDLLGRPLVLDHFSGTLYGDKFQLKIGDLLDNAKHPVFVMEYETPPLACFFQLRSDEGMRPHLAGNEKIVQRASVKVGNRNFAQFSSFLCAGIGDILGRDSAVKRLLFRLQYVKDTQVIFSVGYNGGAILLLNNWQLPDRPNLKKQINVNGVGRQRDFFMTIRECGILLQEIGNERELFSVSKGE